MELATRVLESREAARRWLAHPKLVLGGKAPNEMLDTEEGREAVRTLLLRIEAGVYS